MPETRLYKVPFYVQTTLQRNAFTRQKTGVWIKAVRWTTLFFESVTPPGPQKYVVFLFLHILCFFYMFDHMKDQNFWEMYRLRCAHP